MSPHLAWRRRFHSGNSFSYWAEISGRSGRGLRWTCRLSGFRAAVYGIHFDPWGFGTLLYFVKMVAVFCFNGCREFTFCLCEGASRGGLPYIDFLSTSGIHPPPLARPFSKGLLASDYLSFAFAPLRGSILRLRRAPSLRGYSLRTISLSLSYRCVDPSSAFGAPLL